MARDPVNAAQLPAGYRPLPLRALNAVGPRFERLGWSGFRLDEADLLATARRRARLDDFGEETFRPGLRKLLESLQRDAELNTFGRYFARRQVLELLCHRLRLAEHRKRHPELEDERIERPFFVLGLPRTGTTLLYGLLAQDAACRSPLSWEVDAPCPPPEAATSPTDPRIRSTERRFEQLRRLAPGFQAIHPIGALLPQECVVITACEFLSVRFEMCFDVREYQRWLVHQDMASAYRFHRRFLQHLQSRHPGERWVLKSPGHLGSIETLLAEYPDARIVQTHRDPLRVIPSVSSLEYTMRKVASDRVEPHEIGRQQLWLWSTLLEQGMRARARRPEHAGQFLDLHYQEILSDPLGCVRRVYRHFDLELRPETEARAQAFLARHRRDEHGSHHYSLAAFGLDPEAVWDAFESYTARFGVERESPA